MASPILSFRPEVKIEVASKDITKHLGDVGSVTVRKSLYEPAGHFQIIFPDLPVEDSRESLYGLVSPLDQILIWIRRWREPNQTIEPWIPILTGFVRSIGRDETVGGDGRVQRRVVLAGQDCGAAFLMEQISAFITYQNKDVYCPGPLTWLKEYNLTSQPKKIEDFIWEVAYETTKDIMQKVGLAYQRVFSVEKGTALPNQAFSHEGTVWELLKRYSDPPWNEFFVRENRAMDGATIDPELIFRPTPWYDIADNPLPDFDDSSVSYWEIPLADVISLSAHRDDSELVNHVWVAHPMGNAVAMQQMQKELTGLMNGDTRAKYGDRIQQETTNLNPIDIMHPISLPREEQRAAERKILTWVQERREWLKLAGTEIHLFERGSLTMKGYPHMRVGDYFRLQRGDIVWEAYIINISHQYLAYHQYFTTLEYIRGNQWVRRKEIQNPWDKERKQAALT